MPRIKRKNRKTLKAVVLAIRSKYPELKALDDMTAGLTIIEDDEALLDEYFTQRAKEEGLI